MWCRGVASGSAGKRHSLGVLVEDDHAFLEEGTVDAGGLVAVAAVEAGGVEDSALRQALPPFEVRGAQCLMMRPRAWRSVPV